MSLRLVSIHSTKTWWVNPEAVIDIRPYKGSEDDKYKCIVRLNEGHEISSALAPEEMARLLMGPSSTLRFVAKEGNGA